MIEENQTFKDWEQKLFDKYPKLFRQKDLSGMETRMCDGIACGEGWRDIIDDACQKLQKFADDNGIIIEFVQVKEKFGGLRLYTHIISDNKTDDERNIIWDGAYDITQKAEDLSYKTCEVCGKPGKPRKGGWINTLCDEHAKGREEEREL